MKELNYYMGLNYRVEVVKDDSEGGYVLSIPELKGCLTCSDDLDKGMEMLQDAKQQWIEAALESGYDIPEPHSLDDYSGQFKLRLPKSLHKELAERSRQEGVSMNQYCVYLLSRNEVRTMSRRLKSGKRQSKELQPTR